MSTAQQTALSGIWVINPVHSSINWAVRHNGVSWFRGYFEGLEGKLDATGPEPVLEGSTKVENISIRTPDFFRGHLLGDEFFDAENHPDITFKSTRFQVGDDGKVTVEGDLTIRGTTKSVTATGTLEGPQEHGMGTSVGLELETTVNRFDYGVSWQAPPLVGTQGSGLGEEVKINVIVELDPPK
jgi:polyisoprenoid-binding protein YceI